MFQHLWNHFTGWLSKDDKVYGFVMSIFGLINWAVLGNVLSTAAITFMGGIIGILGKKVGQAGWEWLIEWPPVAKRIRKKKKPKAPTNEED